ncbi:hypothetical protein F0M18_16735 [Pseudohalioglobus sediminis]|uniref:Lipopolysaccharide kinase (Kdo/WaaP) family protein n=1 Tax=Pseudohalioglobus sediminis TaxID=2606449 RepID=A0A5B0WRJ4_9GAMM|nr:lipopolysaccharide kinase InaA family protein [Pseudohalioglobus sediminis]KAA1188851.1 hypothetical protein F0M18_16735 [Pseudohalioglobus sediminis]
MQRLYINPIFKKRLNDLQCCDFKSLSALTSDGDLIAHDKGRTTHRLELAGETYYLKSVHKAIIGPSIESLLSLRMPHHYCWREMIQVNALASADISVMQVAATGEHSRRGVLDYSFLLTPEVPGELLDKVFEQADRDQQARLLSSLGELIGRLHSHGFFTSVRMKDVIVDSAGKFTLIDRETRKPGARRVNPRKAVNGLARTLRRQSRDGMTLDPEQLQTHLQAYLTTAPLSITVEQLKKLV